jgi:hypothetical protein
MTWKKLEDQNMILGILFVGWLPFCIVVKIIDHIFDLGNYFAIPAALIWFIAAAVFSIKRRLSPCPNCGQGYYDQEKFPKQCPYCGAKPPID